MCHFHWLSSASRTYLGAYHMSVLTFLGIRASVTVQLRGKPLVSNGFRSASIMEFLY